MTQLSVELGLPEKCLGLGLLVLFFTDRHPSFPFEGTIEHFACLRS